MGAGEEVSWGQWVIGKDTRETVGKGRAGELWQLLWLPSACTQPPVLTDGTARALPWVLCIYPGPPDLRLGWVGGTALFSGLNADTCNLPVVNLHVNPASGHLLSLRTQNGTPPQPGPSQMPRAKGACSRSHAGSWLFTLKRGHRLQTPWPWAQPGPPSCFPGNQTHLVSFSKSAEKFLISLQSVKYLRGPRKVIF